ncbi:hypothetical protein SAMN06297164_0587 [Nitrosomonas ureae]|uniref:Uncharacterized protein n=1 Tax=Nitrosomonas ureae TaxID=44577 RepID=A0A286A3L4_9PROT|nr:hypothetical protein SAMN06297164_0587 [Nitrosomonas ureae]
MNLNINKPPIVGLHFIQPNLRVVAIEDDAVLGGSMGVLYSVHNVGCKREETCNRIKRLAVVSTRTKNVIYAMNETLNRNLMRILNYSSHRRKPVSSSLVFLDSGLRRNDKFRIIQRLFSKPVPPFIHIVR